MRVMDLVLDLVLQQTLKLLVVQPFITHHLRKQDCLSLLMMGKRRKRKRRKRLESHQTLIPNCVVNLSAQSCLLVQSYLPDAQCVCVCPTLDKGSFTTTLSTLHRQGRVAFLSYHTQ